MKNEVKIHEPVHVALADINFAPYNPRVMPDSEMLSLKASLVKHGFVLNLVVQKDGMILIGGHQRIRALTQLCEENKQKVPTHAWATVLDVNDSTAKQLNVALNKIGGEFDPFRLGELLASLGDLQNNDVLAMGFDDAQVRTLLALVASPSDQADLLEADSEILDSLKVPTITVDFVDVAERDEVRAYFATVVKSRDKKVRTGTILCEMVRATKDIPRASPKVKTTRVRLKKASKARASEC